MERAADGGAGAHTCRPSTYGDTPRRGTSASTRRLWRLSAFRLGDAAHDAAHQSARVCADGGAAGSAAARAAVGRSAAAISRCLSPRPVAALGGASAGLSRAAARCREIPRRHGPAARGGARPAAAAGVRERTVAHVVLTEPWGLNHAAGRCGARGSVREPTLQPLQLGPSRRTGGCGVHSLVVQPRAAAGACASARAVVGRRSADEAAQREDQRQVWIAHSAWDSDGQSPALARWPPD